MQYTLVQQQYGGHMRGVGNRKRWDLPGAIVRVQVKDDRTSVDEQQWKCKRGMMLEDRIDSGWMWRVREWKVLPCLEDGTCTLCEEDEIRSLVPESWPLESSVGSRSSWLRATVWASVEIQESLECKARLTLLDWMGSSREWGQRMKDRTWVFTNIKWGRNQAAHRGDM